MSFTLKSANRIGGRDSSSWLMVWTTKYKRREALLLSILAADDPITIAWPGHLHPRINFQMARDSASGENLAAEFADKCSEMLGADTTKKAE